MVILYMTTGIATGLVAAGLAYWAGAGLGMAFIAYAAGGMVGMVGSALLSILPRGPRKQMEHATAN